MRHRARAPDAKPFSLATVGSGLLLFVVQGILRVPIQGSIALFLAGAALFVFSTTSLGILLAPHLASALSQDARIAGMSESASETNGGFQWRRP